VLGAIPWTTPETATYNVSQGDTVGTGTLQVLAGTDSLVFIQRYEVPDNDVTDEITAETDAETLRPVKVDRLTTDPDFERDCIATYGEGSVTVVQTDEDDEHSSEVNVPNTHYDSWTDLFLWRTIDFKEGFETRYADVLSCNPRESEVITMVLEVKGVEHVTVPAGSFEVWHLKVSRTARTRTLVQHRRLARPREIRQRPADVRADLRGLSASLPARSQEARTSGRAGDEHEAPSASHSGGWRRTARWGALLPIGTDGIQPALTHVCDLLFIWRPRGIVARRQERLLA
jgi:hypothetical protein